MDKALIEFFVKLLGENAVILHSACDSNCEIVEAFKRLQPDVTGTPLEGRLDEVEHALRQVHVALQDPVIMELCKLGCKNDHHHDGGHDH